MFDELEERFRDVLAHLRGQADPRQPQSGRIVRELMDPGFLRNQLEVVAAAGARSGDLLPSGFYDEAFTELDAALKADTRTPFMPRTPQNSLLQSTLTTCVESRAEELLEAAPEGLRRLAHAVLRDEEIFRQFGPCDPRWAETKLAEGWALIDGRPPFPDSAAPAHALAEDARIVVVGDWGTGLPGAAAVGAQMRARLEQAAGRECYAIHLGDVYYSGWREEYETRFLPYWPVERDERDVLCFSLNGNHDMYSGGHGYFGFLLRDPRFRGHWREDPRHQAPSSYFSLENEHWQILGLDSGYEDHDLATPQSEWLAQKLASSKRTMLLTHHQPFSAYESVTQAMTVKVRGALDGQVLDAWLWGHEHRCGIYEDAVPWLRFGSCIGNGGVPQQLPDPPLRDGAGVEGYAPISWAYDGDEPADGNQWLRFGFAVIDLDGSQMSIEYVDEHGDAIRTVSVPHP